MKHKYNLNSFTKKMSSKDGVIKVCNAFIILIITVLSFIGKQGIAQPLASLDSINLNPDISCYGYTDGIADVYVTPASGTYDYSINGGPLVVGAVSGGLASITGFGPGTYSITVTDGTNSFTRTITFTEPPALTIAFSLDQLPGCAGELGTLSANIGGGTLITVPYFTELTNSMSVLMNPFPDIYLTSFSNLPKDVYTLTVQDEVGCFYSQSIALPDLCLFHDQEIACTGYGDGKIQASTTSLPTSPNLWTYTLNGPTGITTNTSGLFTNLIPGTYTVCMNDGVNTFCNTTSFVDPLPLAASFTVDSTVSCLGNDGALTINITGGTLINQPYLTTWSAGTNPIDFFDIDVTNLVPGSYTVGIEDEAGCTLEVSTILGSTPAMVITPSYSAIGCAGGSTSVNASAVNGVAPFTFTVGGVPLPTNLAAGTYTIIGTDVKGCTGTVQFTITQPAGITFTIAVDSVSGCNAADYGGLTATITGGTGPYTTEWRNSSNVLLNPSPNNFDTFIGGLSTGTYSLTVTDMSGCSLTQTAYLPNLCLFKDQDVSCFGFNDGFITVSTASLGGPWTFSRDGGLFPNNSGQFPGLVPGVHTFCATNGVLTFCDTMSILEPLPLVIDSFHVDSTVSCLGNDGAISVFVSGGTQDNQPYLLTWSSGTVSDIYDNSVTGLMVGTYTVDIEDDRGCLLSGSSSVSGTPPMVVTATYSPVLCNGSTTAVSATATNGVSPISFTANGTPLPAALAANTYTIIATDVKGCTGSTVITITQPTAIATTVPLTVCDTYTWMAPNGNGNTYTMSGMYTHTMTAANTCDSVITLNLTVNHRSNNSYTVCAANQYTWPVNGTNYTMAGVYMHTLVAANSVGCDSILTLNLTLIPMTLFKDQDVSCYGFNDGRVFATVGLPGTWTISRDGGLFPITTSGPAAEFQNLTPGTHTICASNGIASYCDTITIYEPLPLVIDSFHVDSTVSCLGNDGAISVFVSGGTQDNQPYLLSWSSGTVADIYDNSVTGLMVGTYTVDIEDDRGCLLSGSYSVGPTPAVVVNATAGTINCNGAQASVNATATGGLAPFTFTIGATTLPANFSAGTYTIVATDVKGCTGSMVISITQPNAIATTLPLSICDSYTWLAPNGNGNTYTMSGMYTHTMTAANSCDSVITLDLTVKYSTNASYTVCAANQYTWPASGINYTMTGVYTHTLLGANSVGCDSNLTLNLTLIPMTLFKDQDVSCYGFNDGRVFATVGLPGTWTISRDGGLFPITTSGAPAEFQNLTPGTHTICASNGIASYCDTITIYEPLLLVIDSFHVDSTVSCLGNDGAISVFVSGGTQDNQPYLLTWSSGTVADIYDNSVTGLMVGTYTVDIEDDRGCLLSGSFAVGLTPAPIITAIYTPIACAGGSTSVDASSVNGVAPFVHTIGATTLPAIFSAGTYTIVSTDSKGCTGSSVITITQPTIAVVNSTVVACDTYTWMLPGNGNTYTNSGVFSHTLLAVNGCDSIQLTLNLTVNYTSSSTQNVCAANHYTWPVNGATYTTSGLYTVTYALGTNVAGCDSLIKLNLSLIQMTLFKDQDVSCFGSNDGRVSATVQEPGTWTVSRDGGLFPITTSGAPAEFQFLTPGVHTICATNGGCDYCDTITILEPLPLVIDSFHVDSTVSCLGNDGALTVFVSGGTADNQPYLLTWSSGMVDDIYDNSVIGLSVGTHTVSIEDDRGCMLSGSYFVGLSPAIVITPTLGTIPCSGGNATISASATGGLAPYTFAIGATPLPANFIAGTYTITATDVKGCTGTLVITQTQPPIFTNTELVTRCVTYTWPVDGLTYTISGNYTKTFFTAAGCDSAQTLILTINPTTSSTTTVTAANSYFWPASGLSYTNSGTFTTTLLGQNANGCDSNLTLVLNILNMTLAVNQHVSCNGNADGSVDASPTGGSGNFEFNVDGGTYAPYFGNTVTGLSVGTHTICAKELPSNVVLCDTITITEPTALSVILTVDSTVSCLGNDGKLTATISGGTTLLQPWLTTWASGVVTNSIYQTTVNGLSAGTYTVTVEDDNLCFASATIVLGLTPPVVVTGSSTPIVCNGGQSVISYTATGGTGALSTSISGGTYTVTAGTYTLTTTDVLGCTSTDVLTITEPALLLFYDTLVRCDSYVWSVNGTTYTNSGNYSSTYTSVNGCDSNYYLNLTVNYSSSSVENVTVANTYTWLADGMTYTNSGTYLYTLTNAAGCDSNLTLNLSILNFTLTLNQDVSCFGANDGSADGIATGGTGNFVYSVDGGAYAANLTGFFPGLTPGTHTICAQELPSNVVMCGTVTIAEPAVLSVVLTVDSTVSCLGNDGDLTAMITGGTTLLQPWLTTWVSGVITNSIYQTTCKWTCTVGTYTVTVEDDHLCFATATIVLGSTPPIVVSATDAGMTCFGDSTLVTPSSTGGTGAKTYTISGGTFTVPAGTYTITATDVKGCTGELVYTVTQPALITTLQTVDSCNTYTWPANSTTYTASGVHVASFVSAAGCDSVVTLNLTIRNSTSSVENVTAANSYTWLANGTNYTLSNTYTHTLTNAVGCDSNLTLILSIVNMNLAVNQHVSCNGNSDGSVNTNMTGGSGNFEFSVDGGSYAPYFGNVVTGLSAGTHTICAKEIPSNVVLCDTITITEPTVLSVVLTVDSTVSCLGNDGAITATIVGGTSILQPYLTTWSSGVTPASIYSTYVTGLAAGGYTVTVEDDNGCFATASVNVGLTPAVTVNVIQQQIVCFGGLSLITPSSSGGTGAKTYSITGGTLNVLAGNYTITATDTKGCTGTLAFSVTEPALLTSTETVFASSTYTWTNGTTYTMAGTYMHTFTSQFGCDSIATLILNFAGVRVAPKVFLAGAYVALDGKMHDQLRQLNLVPNIEPYSNPPYNKPTIFDGNPAEKFVSAAILAKTGDSAVVDWVFVELRSGSNSGTIVGTKRALLLRNGCVVSSVDGSSPLFFSQNIPGNYFVSIKHRNHLGVMTLNALPLNSVSTGVDFTTLAPVYVHSAIPAIANTPRKTVGTVNLLWAGDANANKNVRYNGVLNDKQEILNAVLPNVNGTTPGYRIEDVNMDGIVRYNNTDNDKNYILNNTIGISTPGAVYNQHTPN